VRRGQASATAALEAAIARLAEPRAESLNACVARHGTVRAALAAADSGGAASAARRRAARGAGGGLLAGVPFAAADDIADVGLPTTCGSRLLAGYVSPFESTAVARLLEAGGVLVAKTNADEFGLGRDTQTSAHGPALHPLEATRTPGGASGGLAAAVAAGLVPLGLGVDAGGDLRRPAGYCGVVGFKPTYGRVSRAGAVTHAPSLAQVGAVARTVDDVALALDLAGGRDPLDSTSAQSAGSLRTRGGPVEDGRPLRTLRVGRAREAIEQADAEVAALIEAALVSMRDLGAEVHDVTLGEADQVGPCHRALAAVETASALARFDGVRFGPRGEAGGVRALVEHARGNGLGPAALRQVLLGTHLGADGAAGLVPHAQAARARISQHLTNRLRTLDFIVAPTSRSVAPLLAAEHAAPLPPAADQADAWLLAANLVGLPAVSVPVGMVSGLPVGAHLIGRHFGDAVLVRAAAALERLARAEGRA
jgi:aspartyl-tRNA(Asn)/glutamyl-tRNA(Gln) amidotransferase subunit A